MFETLQHLLSGVSLSDAADSLITSAITTALWACVWVLKKIIYKQPVSFSPEAQIIANDLLNASKTVEANGVRGVRYFSQRGNKVNTYADGDVYVDAVELVGLSRAERKHIAKLTREKIAELDRYNRETTQADARYKLGLEPEQATLCPVTGVPISTAEPWTV